MSGRYISHKNSQLCTLAKKQTLGNSRSIGLHIEHWSYTLVSEVIYDVERNVMG